jgi:alpha-amylase
VKAICLYLHVHQPYRVRPYTVMDAGNDHNYFYTDDSANSGGNEAIFRKVAAKSYLPTNEVLLRLLRRHPEFKVSLSITGTVLEQMEQWGPEVLTSFQDLVATGQVEIVGETYYHSLAFFYSLEEFERQVDIHAAKIKKLFGVKPKSFRNTELAYNNELAQWADQRGYKAIITEGWDPVLEWRSPNYVYRPAYTDKIRLLMKNYRLSDDIAFRFGNRHWNQWPLTAEKFTRWMGELDQDQQVVNLFMDYETFGEHQWAESGIFAFLEALPAAFLSVKGNRFVTITEAAKRFAAKDYVDAPATITWADTERDMSAWIGNSMQQSAIQQVYELEDEVLATNDLGIIADWRRLTTSDHFYYMCTKWWNDGDIHAYFSPYDSPYDAFIFVTNALRDLRVRLDEASATQKKLVRRPRLRSA